MQISFDYSLEEKLSKLTESISHKDCPECKDARIRRLESRASLFQRSKRGKDECVTETSVFHDANDEDYYPFGLKHHHNIHKVFKKKRLNESILSSNGAETSKDSDQPEKRAALSFRHISQSHDEELVEFLSKLKEQRANKRRRIPHVAAVGFSSYASNIFDVDLATLRAHKTLVSEINGEDHEDFEEAPQTSNNGEFSEAQSHKVLELPREEATDNIGDQTPLPSCSNEDEVTVEPIEVSSPQQAESFDEAPSAGTTGVQKDATNREEQIADSGSIFGASTLEKLNFSMPVGNPLFAPKAIDASQFSIPKAPPIFVFGAPSAPLQPPITLPTSFKPVEMAVQPAIPPQLGPQFNIPGFMGPQLGNPVPNAPNTFAMNVFPKARRGLTRYRGGRH